MEQQEECQEASLEQQEEYQESPSLEDANDLARIWEVVTWVQLTGDVGIREVETWVQLCLVCLLCLALLWLGAKSKEGLPPLVQR